MPQRHAFFTHQRPLAGAPGGALHSCARGPRSPLAQGVACLHKLAILYPVFALALWTCVVLLKIPIMRFRSALRRETNAGDYRYGESTAMPPYVSLPNRNYMTLLEIPLLFYVGCLLIYVTGITSPTMLALAWAYVAAHVAHSLIHLGYNNVMHRLAAFALSNLLLIALWVLAAVQVLAAAPAAA